MNKFYLIIGIIAIIAIVLSVVAISSLKGVQFGSTHFTGPIYSEEGYYVDTTERIDGDGAASFTTIAGSGAATLSSTLTVSGESNLDTMVQGGDATAISSASTTLTAAQVCDSAVIKVRHVDTDEGGDILYLASSTDMITDCLPASGDSKKFLLWNYATSTFSLRIDEEWVGSNLDILRPATTTIVGVDNQGNFLGNAFRLEAGDYAWVEYTNMDGSTSTVSFILMGEKY